MTDASTAVGSHSAWQSMIRSCRQARTTWSQTIPDLGNCRIGGKPGICGRANNARIACTGCRAAYCAFPASGTGCGTGCAIARGVFRDGVGTECGTGCATRIAAVHSGCGTGCAIAFLAGAQARAKNTTRTRTYVSWGKGGVGGKPTRLRRFAPNPGLRPAQTPKFGTDQAEALTAAPRSPEPVSGRSPSPQAPIAVTGRMAAFTPLIRRTGQ